MPLQVPVDAVKSLPPPPRRLKSACCPGVNVNAPGTLGVKPLATVSTNIGLKTAFAFGTPLLVAVKCAAYDGSPRPSYSTVTI